MHSAETTALAPAKGDMARWHRVRRPATFIAVGLTSAAVQLIILDLLTDVGGWHPLLANIVAFVVATHVNFALHSVLTWRDRPTQGLRALAVRWSRFMGLIGSTAVINQGIFWVLLHWLPDLVSAATASTLVSGLNFLLSSRLIFAQRAAPLP